MPKVSIITINYNDKSGLEKTINSVLSQKNKDFEFIIIDGGSTDGSVDLIKQHKEEITYWVSEKDKGVYNAQNKGIKVAKGTFINFMNAGDIFNNPNVLQDIHQDLTDDYDIYYGNNYKVKANGSKRLKTYEEKLKFSFFYGSSINHQSSFIRKSLFDKYFYYNENFKIVSDWEFFIYTICKENVPYKYINKTIADYDFTGMSSNEKNAKQTYIERQEVFQKYFPAFIDDYVEVSQLNSKRIQQVLYLQKFPLTWKIFKWMISLFILFTPKKKK